MTKHAIQAMGGVLRNELADFGVDVATINPGPYATGFNDRMANDPGDWFDPSTADAEDVATMESLKQRITVGQLDPVEVVERYVELVEADDDRTRQLHPTRHPRTPRPEIAPTARVRGSGGPERAVVGSAT